MVGKRHGEGFSEARTISPIGASATAGAAASSSGGAGSDAVQLMASVTAKNTIRFYGPRQKRRLRSLGSWLFIGLVCHRQPSLDNDLVA